MVNIGGADTTECPVPEFLHNHNPVKNVLIEDYTGHTCVNCPGAAVIAHDLKHQYGSRVVVISVHAGFFAMPFGNEFPNDFRTEAGTEWDNFFGIGAVGNPNGMVDRTGYSSEHVLTPSAWAGKVNQQLTLEPMVDLQVINDYNEPDRKLCTHIQTMFLDDMDMSLKLCVVLIESGVVSPQKNNDPEIGPTPTIEDYEHEYMLRTAINSTWGVQVAEAGSPVSPDDDVVKSYKLILDDTWDESKCAVVAFVYNTDTYEVLQVVEELVMAK